MRITDWLDMVIPRNGIVFRIDRCCAYVNLNALRKVWRCGVLHIYIYLDDLKGHLPCESSMFSYWSFPGQKSQFNVELALQSKIFRNSYFRQKQLTDKCKLSPQILWKQKLVVCRAYRQMKCELSFASVNGHILEQTKLFTDMWSVHFGGKLDVSIQSHQLSVWKFLQIFEIKDNEIPRATITKFTIQ